VQTAQHDSQADLYRGDLKVAFGAGSAVVRQHGAHEGLHHRSKAEENVAGRKECGERIGCAAGPARRARIAEALFETQPRHATGSRLLTLADASPPVRSI